MSKRGSPCVYGEYWLDRGRNKDVSDKWYIAWYDPAARTMRYKSTRCSDVEAAKEVLRAHVARLEIAKPQENDADVYVTAEIVRYFDEHGVNTLGEQKNGVISSICRCFIGFLKQDEVTIGCKFTELKPPVWKRFIAWRRGPHFHSVKWKGKQYDHASKGVSDTAIFKDIKIIIAALNHAVESERAMRAPVPTKKIMASLSVKRGRTRVLSIEELGAIVGFARSDKPLWHYVMLQLATAMRPEAALKFDCDNQFDARFERLNLQAIDAPLTQKRNPIVPAIPGIIDMMRDWKGVWVTEGAGRVGTLAKRWRTMRGVLGLADDVRSKTIRHTVASMLRWKSCDAEEISLLLGHVGDNRTTAIYMHYDPDRLSSVKAGLIAIWAEANAAADEWCAKWVVANGEKGKLIKVDRSTIDVQPDHFSRLNVAKGLTEEEREARAQRRREGINKARNTRRAKKIDAERAAVRHLIASKVAV